MHLHVIPLPRREENATIHHCVNQVLLLLLTVATCDTLAAFTLAQSRAIAPLEGASSPSQNRGGIIHRTASCCGLYTHELVVQVSSLLEALAMLYCNMLSSWSNLSLIHHWHVVNIFVDVGHQIEL